MKTRGSCLLNRAKTCIESRGGIGEIAAKSGLSRQQLYRTLSDNGNPTLTTLMKVTRAAGVKLFDSTVK
jgi:probable addiction module antidote protein